MNPETLQAIMNTHVGQPIDQATLDADLRRIYGTGDFERVNYHILEEPGKRVLAVDAVERIWGLDYLRMGLGLSNDFSGDAYYNLLAGYRRTWLNALGAEWRTNLQIGRTSSLTTEFYQPLNEKGSFFVVPHLGLQRRSTDLFEGNDRIARYDVSSTLAGVDVGTQFSRYGELRAGIVLGTLKPKLDTGPQSLSPGAPHISQGAFTLRLLLDRLDSVHFPRSGWAAGASVFNANSTLGADQAYTKWDADGAVAYSFGDHTVNLAMKAGGSIGSNPLPRYDQFQWGGFLQMSGYATGQLAGESIRFGRLMYYHRILQGSLFEGAYGGFSLEAGKIGNPLVPGNSTSLLKSASVFVAVDTPVGPVYLGYGRATAGVSSLYFYLGRAF